VAAAQASGVQATLSIPLIIVSDEVDEAAELAGLLNISSRSMQEFDPVDEKLLSLYHRRGAASERHCSPLATVAGHRIAARRDAGVTHGHRSSHRWIAGA
jgi:hypothetical protein